MEYNSDIAHRHVEEGEVKIPDGLLNVKDLHETYRSMATLESLLKTISSKAQFYKKEDDSIFEEHNEEIKTLTWVSIIEIIVVIGCGAYQFLQLKNLIENKQQ